MNNRLLPKIGFVISVLVLLALGEAQLALASQGLNFTTIDVPGAGLTAGQALMPVVTWLGSTLPMLVACHLRMVIYSQGERF